MEKPRIHLLKKLLILIFLPIAFLATNSCKKEIEENQLDEYYVKYEVNSSTIYSGGKLSMIVNTETNDQMKIIIDQRKLSEITIGPVQKGFKATLSVNAQGETYNKLKIYARIYVSKNQSPFALKKIDDSDQPRDSVYLTYTIDY